MFLWMDSQLSVQMIGPTEWTTYLVIYVDIVVILMVILIDIVWAHVFLYLKWRTTSNRKTHYQLNWILLKYFCCNLMQLICVTADSRFKSTSHLTEKCDRCKKINRCTFPKLYLSKTKVITNFLWKDLFLGFVFVNFLISRKGFNLLLIIFRNTHSKSSLKLDKFGQWRIRSGLPTNQNFLNFMQSF